MLADDRAADRQAHPQAIGLGGDERLEEPVDQIGRYAGPAIAHGEPEIPFRVAGGGQRQSPIRGDARGHRLTRVEHEIQEHLLQLYAVAKYVGEVRRNDGGSGDASRDQFSVSEIEHLLGPILKGRRVIVEGRLPDTGRYALVRLGAEVEELRPENEERYVDMTPVIFVFAAVAMAARFVSLGLDDQSMYILSGLAFALLYGLRPFISKLQRPKDR